MSYDLQFFRRKESSLPETAVREYFNRLIEKNESGSNDQWPYRNKETGVYFSFDYGNFDEGQDDTNEIQIVNDFVDTRYSFNLNFLRPEFFGLEAFPIVEKIVDVFDLYVLNPQDNLDANQPRKYRKGELLENWISINAKQSAIFYKKGVHGLNYHPLKESIDSWKFSFHREALQESLKEDIFVAGFFYIKRKGSNIVSTLSTWPTHIPIILPPTDYIYIIKKIKGIFKTKEIKGLTKFETILTIMQPFLDDFECAIPNCKILKVEKAKQAKDAFNSLEIIGDMNDSFEGVTVDQIVNYKDGPE
jgi:hypothetical protein